MTKKIFFTGLAVLFVFFQINAAAYAGSVNQRGYLILDAGGNPHIIFGSDKLPTGTATTATALPTGTATTALPTGTATTVPAL
ncbi:MAG: hypothetical protein DRI57_27065 [Deltaproteobacteria bacterium]|nr:MAG: hypothetical protein DRI57_27065 [Deltaproteobacteria bacterium]